jgi:catechol 2,3-dioxygenase-like lactoylglutathione lyase family enzyme
MQVRALDYIGITVSDLDRALTFYRDVLGLSVEFLEREWGYAELALPPTTIVLSVLSPDAPAELRAPFGGAISVAVAVPDVAAALAEVRERGVPVLLDTVDGSWCEQALIADPDGNRILLHHRKDGTAG